MTPLALRRIRWAIAGALLALFLAFCATAPPCATGGTWIHLQFTVPADSAQDGVQPSGIGRFRVEYQRDPANDAVWDSSRVYQAPGVEGVPPPATGATCDLYVSQSIALHTSRTYRIVSIDNRGNRSGTSNRVVVATGYPDTILALSRPALGFGARPDTIWIGSGAKFRELVRGGGAGYGFRVAEQPYTGWSLQYGDSTEVHALCQEDLQRAFAARICALFGRWALRGGWLVCP